MRGTRSWAARGLTLCRCSADGTSLILGCAKRHANSKMRIPGFAYKTSLTFRATCQFTFAAAALYASVSALHAPLSASRGPLSARLSCRSIFASRTYYNRGRICRETPGPRSATAICSAGGEILWRTLSYLNARPIPMSGDSTNQRHAHQVVKTLTGGRESNAK